MQRSSTPSSSPRTILMTALIAMTLLAFGALSGCDGERPDPAATTPNSASMEPAGTTPATAAVIDHEVTRLTGEQVSLASYRGEVMLIVNTASRCGYTPQFEGLQALYDRYKDQGLVVLGFPSNDFGGQEPGSAEEIATFCQRNYGVSFPMFAKVHARGDEIAPLYRTLTRETGEGVRGDVQWNFTKFLVDREGHVIARFESGVEPLSDELVGAVEAALTADDS